MNSRDIPELTTAFIFRKRPEPIPGDLRPAWRIGLVLLMLHISSRGQKSSFGRLHVLNWSLRSNHGREALLCVLSGKQSPTAAIVRVEPSLNRAVDFAHGENLLIKLDGRRLALTDKGQHLARAIMQNDNMYITEILFLKSIGKKLTESVVGDLLGKRF